MSLAERITALAEAIAAEFDAAFRKEYAAADPGVTVTLAPAEAADRDAAKGENGKRGWKTAAAAGLGIGSAAVIAALLYANRGKIK